MRTTVAFTTAFIWAMAPVCAGEFLNLGFDQPDLTHLEYDALRGNVAPVGEVLRGWSVTPIGDPLPYGGLITVGDVGPPLGLYQWLDESARELYGDYSLGMSPDWVFQWPGQAPPRETIVISQTGLVPTGAGLLVFSDGCSWPCCEGAAELSMDGQKQTQFGYWEHPLGFKAIDVSAFAGREVRLDITFPEGAWCRFDIRGFEVVPEPSACVLMVLGGAALLLARWRLSARRRR